MIRWILCALFAMGCSSAQLGVDETSITMATQNPCHRQRIMKYDISSAIDDANRDIIEAALEMWHDGTNGRLTWVRISADPEALFFRLPESQQEIDQFDGDNPGSVLGVFDPSKYQISLMLFRIYDFSYYAGVKSRLNSSDIDGKALAKVVIAHEIGHALGLMHNDRNRQTYMHASVTDIPQPLWSVFAIPAVDRATYWNLDTCDDNLQVVLPKLGQ